eukprot:CAMPEP_0173191164 /NCGR_PEP_ID=MMETSP1141-20130122/12739_1 /TAXON_ID=483371 /ORGANISM="non described non described, Strain CCMP2298" /LENGTH=133 /DNA_ID=CAMNT_0014115335 /DNA_START=76 /DNA_END=477 /DNA_ORIENTATION=+
MTRVPPHHAAGAVQAPKHLGGGDRGGAHVQAVCPGAAGGVADGHGALCVLPQADQRVPVCREGDAAHSLAVQALEHSHRCTRLGAPHVQFGQLGLLPRGRQLACAVHVQRYDGVSVALVVALPALHLLEDHAH